MTGESADREMPRYQCHKKVWALKIAALEPAPPAKQNEEALPVGSFLMTPIEPGYGKIVLSADYMLKHKPQVGGYYVVYEDGYLSWSPARVFEDGYTLITD